MGEAESVYSSHNYRQWSKCKYHHRNKDFVAPAGDDDPDVQAEEIAADLRSIYAPASVAMSHASSASIPPAPDVFDGVEIGELVKRMFAGKLTRIQVQEVLVLRSLSSSESDKTEAKAALESLRLLDADVGAAVTKPKDDSSRELATLQSRHGRLLGLYISTHKRILNDLHLHSSSSSKPVMQSLDSGVQFVEVDVGKDISVQAMLHEVLCDTVYLASALNYMSQTESRALCKYVARKFNPHANSQHPQLCIILHRTVKRLLQLFDSDPASHFDEVLKAQVKSIYDEELEIVGSSTFAGFQAGKRVQEDLPKPTSPSGALSYKDMPNAIKDRLPVPRPMRGICWYDTNGLPCADLDPSGQCKFKRFHGKCCGRSVTDSSGNTTTCKDHHRAVDHP
jgi:hypothetical protein